MEKGEEHLTQPGGETRDMGSLEVLRNRKKDVHNLSGKKERKILKGKQRNQARPTTQLCGKAGKTG